MLFNKTSRLLALRSRYLFCSNKPDHKAEWESKKQIFKEIAPYVVPFQSGNKEVMNPLLKSYFYLALSRICLFGGPLFLKYGIDSMKIAGMGIDPLWMILGYGACFIGSTVFVSCRSIYITKVSYAAMKEVSMKLYRKLLSLPRNFHISRPQS